MSNEKIKQERENIETNIEKLLIKFALTFHKDLKFNNQAFDYTIQNKITDLLNLMSTYKDDDRNLTRCDVLSRVERKDILNIDDNDTIMFMTNNAENYKNYDNVRVYVVDENSINLNHHENKFYILIVYF